MGRIFEKRKERMFSRWSRMSKAFTKMGREISIAVKQNGPDPSANYRLRAAIQTAKSLNMPKDRIEVAITRSSLKNDTTNYQEITYEGYAPHGVAFIIETATDNVFRTVANLKATLTRGNGSMASDGSVVFLFDHIGVFNITASKESYEEMSLNLIDHGALDIEQNDDNLWIHTKFTNYHYMYNFLNNHGITIINSELQHIPKTYVDLNEHDAMPILKLIEKIEDDNDVQALFHNLRVKT